MNALIMSFKAYNINAFNNLMFIFMENWLLFIGMTCAIFNVLMLIRDVMEDNVVEEQNIL